MRNMGTGLKMTTHQPITLAQQPMNAEGLVSTDKHEWPEFLRRADESHFGDRSGHFMGDRFLLPPAKALLGASAVLPCLCGRTDERVLTIQKIGSLQTSMSNEFDVPSNTLVVLATVPAWQSRTRDNASDTLVALSRLAREKDCDSLAIPVRPSRKSEYPLIPFATYVNWQRSNGSPFDPELRIHLHMGGFLLAIAHRALVLEGTVAQWERWSKMHFAESGEYIVDGAMKPVIIDCENNRGYYDEANVWVLHNL